jgi:uncharacterized membrane protein
MTDFTPPPLNPVPQGTAPPQAEHRQCTPEDVAAGKVMAILSYVLNLVIKFPFFAIPLIMRNDRFSLYHAKQCLIVWLMCLAGSVVLFLLGFVTCGVGWLLLIPLYIVGLVLDLIGLINAVNGRCEPVPMVGRLGERWFAGIEPISKPGVSL